MTANLAATVLGTPDPPALADDLAAEVERAVRLAASVEKHQPDGVRVLRDPHGHLLCLFLPGY